MTHHRPGPVLAVTAGIASLLFLGIFLWSFDRSVWLDEVFTLSFTGGELDQQVARWREDVHPPLYYAFVSLARSFLSPGDPVLAGRLVNVGFLVAIVLALYLTARRVDLRSAAILTVLVLCNGAVAYYAVEIRAYFGMFALSLLMSVALIFGRSLWETALGLIAALVLSQLHFFGTATALAMLGWLTLEALYHRDWARSAAFALVALGVLACFGAWIIHAINYYVAIHLNGFWIRPDGTAIPRFLRELVLLPALAAAAGLIALAGRGQLLSRQVAAFAIPVLLVVILTQMISIWQPIMTPRNLVVLAPQLALLGMWGLRSVQRRRLVDGGLLAGLAVQGALMVPQSWPYQNADWVITQTLRPECANVPLAVDTIDLRYWPHAARAFGLPERPTYAPSTYAALLADGQINLGACTVIAADHHRIGWMAGWAQQVRARGFEIELQDAPGPQADWAYGSIITLKP